VAQAAAETSRAMTFSPAPVVAVPLPTRGIGIMSVILLSVTERVRMVGFRLQVGLGGQDVLP
jgi:hypothetical protein